MIESLTCPNCGQAIKSSKTDGVEDSKSVTCNVCKLKSSLGQWRLVSNSSPIDVTPPAKRTIPPLPPQPAVDRPEKQNEVIPSEVGSFNRNLVFGLWIGGGGLLLTCISPFFKWINLGAGGVMGIAGDGKVLLAISLIAVGSFVTAIAKRKWTTRLLIAVQAWGTIVTFWMGSLLWKLSSLVGEKEVEDNILAALFSTMFVSPGSGLYVGLIGGIAVAGAIGYVSVLRLLERGNVIPFVVTQAIALCIGVVLVIFVGPSSVPKADRSKLPELFNFENRESSEEKVVEALLGKTFTLGNLEITPMGLDLVTLHERPLFGDLQPRKIKSYVFTFTAKNISEGQVFHAYTSINVTDNFANSCPDPTDSKAFSGYVRIDGNEMFRELQPGEAARVMVAFDPQLESAKEFSCLLTTSVSNQSDYEKWRIKLTVDSSKQMSP